MTRAPSLNVAIADDDRATRELLQKMLENLGHQVVAIAEDGQSLVNRCAATGPDVVITDHVMPDITGLEAAAAICKLRPTSIILLSAFCDRELVLDAEQKHVAMYLVKPVSQDTLEAALERCWRQSSAVDVIGDVAGDWPDDSPRIADVATLSGPARPPYRPLCRVAP